MRYKELIEDSPPSQMAAKRTPEQRAALLMAAQRKGYVIDPKDTNLTGGIEATPELVIAAITDTADAFEVYDTTTPEDIRKWLWSD